MRYYLSFLKLKNLDNLDFFCCKLGRSTPEYELYYFFYKPESRFDILAPNNTHNVWVTNGKNMERLTKKKATLLALHTVLSL